MRLPSLLPAGAATSALDALTSRLGTALLAAVVAFWIGSHSAGKECDLAAERARIEAVQKDLATSQAAESLAHRQAGSLEAQLKANQDRLRALQVHAQRSPAGSCRLDERDARQLRHIR